MANEREITIKLAAKNLTAAEFAKAREEILGLNQAAEKSTSTGASVGPTFTTSFKAVAAGAAMAVGVVASLAAGLGALAVRGSDVGDVHAQFNVLNRSIGNVSGSLIGTLRGAMRGTVSDFELMKSTNQALSQGLRLNESQFDLTGKAARVLADRIGGDSAEAYNTLTMAMATGQDRQLKSIGLNIDAEAAVKRHAAALGVQVGDLTEAEQITAKRNATLAEMERVLAESGEAEVDFADLVDQGTTAVSNFIDGLGEGIATSPVLTAAIGPIGDAIATAFGGSSEGLIRTIVGWIETGALAFVSIADAGLGAADSIVRGFFAVEARLASAAASAREFIASMPGASDETKRLAEEMRRHATESAAAADGSNKFSSTVATLRQGLQGARDAMLKAREEQALAAASGEALKGKTDDLSAALHRNAAASGSATAGTARQTIAQREAAAATKKLMDETAKFGRESLGVQEQFDKGMLGKFTFELRDVTSLESRTIGETAKLRAEAEQWAQTNMAVLAPSIRQVGSALDDTGKKGNGFTTTLKGAFKDLPNVMVGAMQGGGNVGKSVGASLGGSLGEWAGKAAGPALSKMLGKGIGGAVGTMFGPVGTMVGGFLGDKIGNVAGKVFGGLFGDKGKKEAESMRNEFIQSAGGLEVLKTSAAEAGVSLDALMKAKNAEQVKAAIDGINGAIGKQQNDLALARQAMDEWGISSEEAGQKFAQADMDKRAGDMLAKLKAATAAGVDLNAIVSKGGDDFGSMVHQAIRSGTTISNEFRPVLAAMIENKSLVDENGEAFTDLSQIPFADDIGGGLKEVATSLKELASLFMGGMSNAFKAAGDRGVDFASRVNAGINGIPRSIEIEVNGTYNPPDIEGSGPGYAIGTKGRHGSYFVNFGQGTETQLHGYEAVITPEQTPDFVAEYLSRLGGGGRSAGPAASPNVYVLVEVDAQGRTQRSSAISEREYMRREMQQLLRSNAVMVPTTAVGAA